MGLGCTNSLLRLLELLDAGHIDSGLERLSLVVSICDHNDPHPEIFSNSLKSDLPPQIFRKLLENMDNYWLDDDRNPEIEVSQVNLSRIVNFLSGPVRLFLGLPEQLL